MAYTPQQWHDDTTDSPYGPISGDRLNYIESGIQAAAAAADAAGTAAAGGAVLGTAAPIIDGVAAAGTSGSAAHEDHVHPTDTSRAALASPTFSGTPSLPTASVGVTQSAADSSLKLATTAFVTTADNLKANLAGPTFTGSPVLPTGTTGVTQTAADNSTKLSTTAYADAAAAARAPASGIAESAVTNLVSDLAAKAPLASPTFTGTATIPNIAGPTTLAGTVTLPSTTVAVTASASDNSTKPATTAYVDTADALKANLASPTFTGTVTLPSVVAGSPTFSGTVTIGAMAGTPTLPSATVGTTQATNDFSTKLATTAYVDTLKLNLTMAPSGALAFPFDRGSIQGTTRGPAAGTIYMTACYLTAGMVISNLNILPNATSVGITHTWMAIFSAARILVATTNDDTTAAAFTAATVYTKPITQIASGASATYTVPTTGLYYLGHMQAGTAIAIVAASTNANSQLIAPILGGSSSTSKTVALTDFAGAQTAITAGVARDHIWPS